MRLVASKAACRRWTQQYDWFGVCAHCAHAHLDAGRHCDVWVLEGLEACELQRDMMNNEAYSNGWRLKLEDKTRRRAAAAPAEAKAIADATDKELGRGLILGPFTTFKYLVRAVSDALLAATLSRGCSPGLHAGRLINTGRPQEERLPGV